VVDADRFGNLLTSIPAARLAEIPGSGGVTLEVAGRRLGGPVDAYAEGAEGEPAVIVGSMGRLEIFVKDGSARDRLGVGRGTIVRVRRAE
jgi:S-adenosyl-L-methionine hydrolase (adenosine-forming)